MPSIWLEVARNNLTRIEDELILSKRSATDKRRQLAPRACGVLGLFGIEAEVLERRLLADFCPS